MLGTPEGRLERRARGSGFTLVEILVVVAVIGILASILLPVLTKGKDRAVRTVDINNLKQIVTTMHHAPSRHGP